jgi:CDP-diacylglycerol--serine O-phosphatidyltransferase
MLSLSIEGSAIAGIFSLQVPAIPSFYLLLFVSFTAIGSSLLLVSEIRFLSLKIKSLAWKGNELRYVLLISAVGSIVCFGFGGIAVTILLYLLFSILNNRIKEISD